MIPFSVLDLSPVAAGATPADAFRNTLDLAQHAERWDYRRFWLAEHHNMTGIASAATSVVIGHVAGGTKTIRVGSGGIMLPNHAPLVIAEQFGTLESLYPGRIDLGLGRAPGTDQSTARALRRDLQNSAESFPHDVVELQRYFADPVPGQTHSRGARRGAACAAVAAGLDRCTAPSWRRRSACRSRSRRTSRPTTCSPRCRFIARSSGRRRHSTSRMRWSASICSPPRPTTKRGCLFTSLQQQFINLRRGTPGQLQPPVERLEASEMELNNVAHSLACTALGDRDAVREGLRSIIAQTGADELMLTAQIYDHDARLRSFEIGAQVREELMAANA